MKIVYFSLVFVFFIQNLSAQLSFCEGSKGDAIFHEDFETDSGTGPALPTGTTDYNYVSGPPMPGDYTIWEHAPASTRWWFSEIPQVTPSGGRFLLVDAGYSPGLFYETEISGLCENTSYEFSAFLMNLYDAAHPLCPNGGIPINVKFEIWDETDSQLLGSGSTGEIRSSFSPQWEEYALTFQSEPGQNTVILRMYNNGEGGCGNDVAIDDIIFRSCGDFTEITSAVSEESVVDICQSEAPISFDLTARPDFAVYETHAFQWQERTGNEEWQDIPGATAGKFTTPQLNSSRHYRVKVAEDEVNVQSNLCSSASEAFNINIIEKPAAPQSEGNQISCSNEVIPALNVQAEEDESVNWYASENGNEILAENTSIFIPEREGIFYAEAVKNGYNCSGSDRTAVELKIFDAPEVQDEVIQFCADSQLQLDAGVAAAEYFWSSGENSRQIEVTSPGNYMVTIVSEEGCSAEKNFQIEQVEEAVIEDVYSEGNKLIIEPDGDGEFEYSIDGNNFQISNKFELSGGVYIIYMRDRAKCNTVTQEFPPMFITPNGDGNNDYFEIQGLNYFSTSQISIFDRYGKLLKTGKGENFSWDGSFNSHNLPADDYWFEIILEGYGTKKGNFSLIR
ncbi:T9SS type B sorting domain-containing protein [Salegentibacter sp. F188]|uniref:T9SS type B sorting domain-containing protein n=1 Tax=Autumnicola patrickiae TaxID=3075591 RepID=A0ABU3DY87_9FLAO|nr:T9SS type B sorting domain-containing protein [Salegentibacter sp. F188]MDT0688683.1 T9SS type B sorting domain-containing protein [Salegentibacter sp. F188]